MFGFGPFDCVAMVSGDRALKRRLVAASCWDDSFGKFGERWGEFHTGPEECSVRFLLVEWCVF